MVRSKPLVCAVHVRGLARLKLLFNPVQLAVGQPPAEFAVEVASVQITWAKYHHLLPGTMDEAAELIQAFIDRPVGTIG